jgi:archaellum component FlaF (FlaF/FlaG flagellin family)
MARRIVVAAIIIGVALTVIFVGVISNEPFIPMPNEEEIGISNVVYVSASNTVLVTVENQGSRFSNVPHNVTFVEAFLNGTDVTSNWASSKGTFTISKGESTVIALIVPSITKGEEYSVKLVTAMGTTCISSLRV